ncbi:MAG: hypothetical protein A2X19_09590 [Bacteroidetes bacterium GWE2_39_28]|nr:MAG: hypothetical protein A2X19_09590 [Bacteroidetes bacterium GWE2_39_28]OFY12358.1 MAG: hypothetical protein A2X16_07175 [Bacteroidetes bacterium GWF2_39_10]OFZ08834.1 MAG: hypothetical protein A2322_07540 [Bacteroidetes bacterium RIFOXYB2_FULL_39_7]OFZ12008.1 MAG: hypothetical protein A2465_08645 [Bacteroidetes bacterium RIFOXYC2_FULL_39_11]HCT95008.1 hypothetical protein [Rikenellaceae bacterium]
MKPTPEHNQRIARMTFASVYPHYIAKVICGYRIEEIEDPLTKQVRYLDKLVEELAKGRKIEKILRTS